METLSKVTKQSLEKRLVEKGYLRKNIDGSLNATKLKGLMSAVNHLKVGKNHFLKSSMQGIETVIDTALVACLLNKKLNFKNDAPRGGANGDHFELSKKELDLIKKRVNYFKKGEWIIKKRIENEFVKKRGKSLNFEFKLAGEKN